MTDIPRIRALIAAGKNDADIAAQLEAEAREANDLGTHNPGRTFRSLALTMHRACTERRAVSAHEVVVQLDLFRRFWEEIAARGDVPSVEKATLDRLRVVMPAESVSEAYVQLHANMHELCRPVTGLTDAQRTVRIAAERRYLRKVAGESVICCAGAASAVADACNVLYQALGHQAHYRDLFPPEVLQPCAFLLLVYHPTWAELLAEAKTPQ